MRRLWWQAQDRKHGTLVTSSAWSVAQRATSDLLSVYAMRMAAVFTMAASTILLRTRIAPRWLVAAGYAIAVLLLAAINVSTWVALLFPALSLHILIASFRSDAAEEPEPDR